MKIIKKLFIIIGISLIAVLVLGTLLYWLYLAPKVDRYLTEKVQSTLEEQFKREVSIGSIRLNFPNPHITISDVAIAREQKLSAGTLLSAKTLKAKVLLRSLISERILIDDIVLESPTIWIEFDEQGQSNLPSFGGEEKEEEPQEESWFDPQKLVQRLYFPRIQLIDGEIYFAHQQIPLTVSVQRLNTTISLALKGLKTQGNISLQGGEIEFQDRGKMAVALSGDLQFENNSLTLSSFDVQVNNSEVTVDGTLANITRPDLDLSVKVHLALEELDKFLRINQNLAGIVDFEGTVTGQIPDITAAGHLTSPKGSAWKLNFENVSTDVTYQQQQVIISNLGIDIFDGRATGDGKLSFSGTPSYQASLTVEKLNIEHVNTLISQQLPLAGKVSGDVEVKADSFDFEDLILHASPNLLDVTAYDVSIPQADAQIDIRDETLYIKDLHANLFQGKVVGNGNMSLSSTPNYQVSLDVQKVQLDPIMALIPQPPDVIGQVSGKITASGEKFDLDSLLLEADLDALNVDGYKVKAKTLNTSVQIKDGILSLLKFAAQLFEGEVAGQGMLVLTGETLPKFDVQATLKNISVQSVIRQFAPNVNDNGIAFGGNISGDVTLAGNSYELQDIKGTAALNGKGEVDTQAGEVPFDLLVNCSLQENIVDISDLSVDSSTLMLTTSGTVNVASPELNLNYEVASKDIQTMLKQILMFIPGIEDESPLYQFSGNIEQIRGTIQGPVSQLQIQADAHFSNADFVWIEADDITADISYQENILVINRLQTVHKSASIEVDNGSIDLTEPADPQLQLPVSLKSGKLSDYLAMVKQEYPVEGTVQAVQSIISGPVNNLQGEITLSISDGTAWEQSFDRLSGELELAGNRLNINSLTIKKNGGNVSLEGFFGFDLSFRAALTATDLNVRDIDAFKDIAVQYQGQADITIEAEGTIQNPRGKAAIRFKNLVYNDKQIEDITCDIVMENQTIQAQLATFRKKFIASLQLALTPELLYRAELVMESAAVEQILSFATTVEGISGLISGTITSEGSLNDIQKLSAEIKLSELQLDIFGQQVKNSKEIDVIVTPQKLTVNSLELRGKELGLFAKGFLDFQGNFDLDLDGIIDLRPVLAFLPKTIGITYLEGHVQLICNVRGTFENPEIEGIAEIERGSLQHEAYPDPVENIRGKLAFTKGRIEIIRLQGDMSRGSFVSSGTFNYRGLIPETFSIEVEGKNIIVQNVVEALTMTVSPQIRISGDLKRQKLVGEIVIHNALYKKELDLREIVFDKNREILLPTIETGEEEGQIELNLVVKAPKNIRIRNRLAELDLRANINIQGTTAKPQLEGRVEILQGKVQFGDITYQIISGVLDFIDPLRINPEMNIRVETVVQEYKISLGIEGNLDQFTLDMSSEPELSKGQITQLLAAGSGGGANGYGFVTKPIQTLVEGQIEKAVNLDRFTVDVDPLLSNSSDTEATPSVTLGKRLFKDLLLTYTTTVGGTERAQTVEIEYQFSDNISLTARRNETGEVDASFTFKFKIK